MAHTLSIASKLLSLKDRFQIADAHGKTVFDCTWRFSLLRTPWVLERNGQRVAVWRRKLWAFASTWTVESDHGNYRIRRKVFSFRRVLQVRGGPLDGAELVGSVFDRRFTLRRDGVTLAKAREEWVSLRDRYDIDIVDERPEVELLTAVLMAQLLIEKRQERRVRDTEKAA